jgi:Cu2+-exporting ATPase
MSCALCDLPTPDPPVTDEAVTGAFCCRGCLEVARTLGTAETDAAEARESLDTGPTDAAGEEAFLAVDGMHCATCEAFVEARATGHEGVRAADASYPTGTVRLVHDPETVDREALPGVLDGLGYSARDPDDPADDERSTGRLLVGAFFGMMTMCWYVLFLYPSYLGVDRLLLDVTGLAGDYLLWNVWVMTTVVLLYTGGPMLRGAYVSLRAGLPNMDLLVALAATTAYLYSTLVLLTGGTEVYFDVATVVVLAVTVGDHYESRVRERVAGRLTDLVEERVEEAARVTRREGAGPEAWRDTETVRVDALAPGDEVVVRAGDRVPVDGVVTEGSAAVDESLVTGESRPVRVETGDEAVGGALVTDGALVVTVGPDPTSTLDRIVRHLWAVQSARPGAQRVVDRLAAVVVPLVVVLAVVAVGGHLAAGARVGTAVLAGLATLVVSCPCALGLATPLATAAGVRTAADAGLVVTDASAFERAPDADVVAFDKTGTLTTGEMRVVERPEPEALRRAAAVEARSDHPVARALVDAAPPTDAAVTEFENHPGRGVSARVDGERVVVGRPALFRERGWTVPDDLAARADEARERGHVPSLVGWDGHARDIAVTGDSPRPEWESVVSALAAERRVVVITGDDERAAARFRDHPDVAETFAGVPPAAKAEVVERLREEGTVAMVGDGSNDAPALAAADIGIAFERTALSADAADAVVTNESLAAVPSAFEVTAATNRRIRQNLGWALCYNAIAVPLAVLGLLNPLFAAVAMATSSLLVVGNSLRSMGGEDGDAEAAAPGDHGRRRGREPAVEGVEA